MFKFEQLEKDLTEMYSVSNSGNVNSELVKKLIGEFFSARNDLVFLRISIKGSNFNELHTLLNEYYDHADSDIDTLLELYVSVFKKSFNCREYTFSVYSAFQAIQLNNIGNNRLRKNIDGGKGECNQYSYCDTDYQFVSCKICGNFISYINNCKYYGE